MTKTRRIDTTTMPEFLHTALNAVGFDTIADDLLSAQTRHNNYPPYNVIRINDDRYVVELAVAGFTSDDLEIKSEKNRLVILTKESLTEAQSDDVYIHKGIAMRQFEQTFILAEHIKVQDAVMKNGLLRILLIRDIPEAEKSQTIPIKS